MEAGVPQMPVTFRREACRQSEDTPTTSNEVTEDQGKPVREMIKDIVQAEDVQPDIIMALKEPVEQSPRRGAMHNCASAFLFARTIDPSNFSMIFCSPRSWWNVGEYPCFVHEVFLYN